MAPKKSSKRKGKGLGVDNTVGVGIGSKDNVVRHAAGETGYCVDISDLLFTAEGDFLLKNKEEVRLFDLKGKTIVLFIFPLDPAHLWGIHHPDMIDAYNEMQRKGDRVEFVLVPVAHDLPVEFPISTNFPLPSFLCPKDVFSYLFSTIPFPSIPFPNVAACGPRVQETFGANNVAPYWVVIGSNQRVVTTSNNDPYLFKLFGGYDLYPLTINAIQACSAPRARSYRKHLLDNWEQQMQYHSQDTHRDFLLRSNGEKVPVSSLKNKVIGLYFSENIPNPPRMQVIKNVYHEAEKRGHDFQIVQINFHYHFISAINVGTNPTVEPCHGNISWLTLPFKDPSCRRLQHIFNCADDDEWDGDCLVILDTRQSDVLFEFSGAEIFQAYGVAAYPFTRASLYRTEYLTQKRELTLESLFPPGEPLLANHEERNVSYLLGKNVFILFADKSIMSSGIQYLAMLEAEYVTQKEKFEVVYISTDQCEASFDKYRGFLPWLVHPYSVDFAAGCLSKLFKVFTWSMLAAAAFDEHGLLIAKEDIFFDLEGKWGRKGEEQKPPFPFISHSLETAIEGEVETRCALYKYYPYEHDVEA